MFKENREYKKNKDRIDKERKEKIALAYSKLSYTEKQIFDAIAFTKISVRGTKGEKTFIINYDIDRKRYSCRTYSELSIFDTEYHNLVNSIINEKLKSCGVSWIDRPTIHW